jgi:glycosyltransferase involved in cell wall biosynthesis
VRILLLNWRDKTDRSYGGAEEFVGRLADELAKRCEVTFFTSKGSGSDHEKDKNLEIIRRGSVNTVYFWAIAHMLKNRKKYDAVVESVSSVPFFSSLVFDRRKIFLIVHHVMGMESFRTASPPKALAAYAAERFIPSLYKGSVFLVNSNFVRSQLENLGVSGNSIRLIKGHIAAVAGHRAAKSRKPTIISVCRLVKYKRVDMLIRMFANLRRKVPNAEFVIVGEGPERSKLESLSRKLGLGNCIRFTGFLAESEKAVELSKAWVFVTASRIEGLGISVLEAESCGLPTVAFANGGLAEVVRDGYSGFLVKEGDEKAFVEALYSLIRKGGKQRLAKMSANAVRHFSSFGSGDAAKIILKLARSSLSASARRTGKPRKAEQGTRGAT